MVAEVKREDLVVRYVHTPFKVKSPPTAMIAQTLPMASMFMRNKMLSWVSFSLCLQHYLNYGNVQTTDEAATSPFLSLILSAVGVVTAYMDILIPVPNGAASIAATTAAETVAEAVAGATASTVL